jgi:hypothetical protein
VRRGVSPLGPSANCTIASIVPSQISAQTSPVSEPLVQLLLVRLAQRCLCAQQMQRPSRSTLRTHVTHTFIMKG